ncbi:hypothetical protein KCM76_02775 [Zooshikella marina]|uniref:hypothetical protein n=1 Tax=Zooshikella ganghwensis TaxID=202772 RepID=UPI001BB08981|nr:hypothetical protein [Zooshikella ganghwensis]MBU2704885.1 hypothetical protein [Zooshikella ganghwensis]
MKRLRYLLLFICFWVSGCLFPERFSAEIAIHKDLSFDFKYEGILTAIMARADETEQGHISSEREREMLRWAEELKRDPGFKQVNYIGHGQFKVAYEKHGQLDKSFAFVAKDIKLISIVPKKNNTIEIKGLKVSKSRRHKLNVLGMTIEGDLHIVSDLPAIQHNAQEFHASESSTAIYHWHVASLTDPAPRLVLSAL